MPVTYSTEEMERFAKAASPRFKTSFLPKSLRGEAEREVGPPGWEPAIKKMKKNPDIDNPWALAHWMHNQGIRPKKSKSSEAEDAQFDRQSPPKGYPAKSKHYADPENFKYPIDTEKHVRAAISYFSQADNRKGYSSEEQAAIWKRINAAAKKFGIERSDESKEAVSATSQGQLFRYGTTDVGRTKQESSVKIRNFSELLEAKVKDGDKRQVEVVIMTEGLGNKRDMHYYSQECIQKAVKLFEGAPCFADHPSETEEVTRPERSVRDLVGYYEDVHTTDGGKKLVGTLCLENTEEGQYWFDKIKTALDYAQKYPDKNYFAISINADGKTHEGKVDGQDVNIVDEITEVDSADLVTRPALDTKFVRLLNSLREAEKSGNERRISRMAKMTKAAIADEARKLAKRASETESGETQKIGDLAKGLKDLHDKINPHDQLVNAEAKSHLKKAMAAFKCAEDEDDMDTAYGHLKNFVKSVTGPDDGDDGDDQKEEAMASEGRKRASEDEDEDEQESKEARKKASEDEDEDEDEDEQEAYQHGVKAAKRGKASEDEDEDEDEQESKEARLKKAEAKLKKAAKIAMGETKEDNGKGDGRSNDSWRSLVKDAHSDLYPGKQPKSAESKEKESEVRFRREAVSSLRETQAGRALGTSKVDMLFERNLEKLRRQADEGSLLETQARENSKRLLRRAHQLFEASRLPQATYDLVMDRLIDCDNERQMTRIIEGYQAFYKKAGRENNVISFEKVEGHGGRREEFQESDEDERQDRKRRLLDGVLSEAV